MTRYFYTYKGPVMVYNTCITNNWTGSTWAVSEKKALSNLTYQFKKETGRNPNTKITLVGKLKKERGEYVGV